MKAQKLSYNKMIIVPEKTTVKAAAEKMAEKNIGLLVVGTSKSVKGVFSERDLLKRVVAKGLDLEKTALNEVMTTNVIAVHENEDPAIILKLMAENGLRHVIVAKKEKPCGIISLRDLLQYMIDSLNKDISELNEIFLEQVENEISGIIN